MAIVTIWHNPPHRCSKSRQTLALLQAAGVEILQRRYLEDPPTLQELQRARTALGDPPVIDMMRTGEPVFKATGLGKSDSDADLLAAMVKHQILIERPMVFAGGQGVIGRPPENVQQLL